MRGFRSLSANRNDPYEAVNWCERVQERLRKSSDFILLWDNLLIPEDVMLAIPPLDG